MGGLAITIGTVFGMRELARSIESILCSIVSDMGH